MKLSWSVFPVCAIASLLFTACTPSQDFAESTDAPVQDTPSFYYDESAMADKKPWSSEDFKNNPRNFQFAIIGD